jgi:hypothetical protein
LFAACFALGACATAQQGPAATTPAEQQLRDANSRFNSTVAEGAAVGTVVGAVGGALLGKLIGGSGSNVVKGAVAGAALGAGIGGALGYQQAFKNEQQVRTEANIAATTRAALADADAYEKSAQASRTIADEAATRAATLRGQLADGSVTQAQYIAQMRSYSDDLDIMKKQLASASAESDSLRAAAATLGGNDGAERQAAADRIDAARSQMQGTVSKLTALLDERPGT